jgi:hypothetical protein
MKFFLPMLTLVFIFAQLLGAINWSWWLILSPLFFGFMAWVFAFALLGLVYHLANHKK